MQHFLIIKSSLLPKYVYLGCYKVNKSQVKKPPRFSALKKASKYIFEGNDTLKRLLKKIKEESIRAIATVDQVVKNMRPYNNDIKLIVTRNYIKNALKLSNQIANKLESKLADKVALIDPELLRDQNNSIEEELDKEGEGEGGEDIVSTL